MRPLTFGSLFAGVASFDLGFERSGLRCLWQCEIDKDARRVLQARFPAALLWDDVRTLARVNPLAWKVDVICGGFPCQDLSVAGKRAGLDGERSGLFYEMVRITHAVRPRFLVWENVPGLLSSDDGRDFARALWNLGNIGYRGAWRVLDAQFFGVPQRRRRVFGVFARGDSGAERCAEILALTQGRGGHPAAGREAAEDVAASLRSRSASAGVSKPGRGGEDDQNLIVGPVADSVKPGARRATGNSGSHGNLVAAEGGNRQSGELDVATACNAKDRRLPAGTPGRVAAGEVQGMKVTALVQWFGSNRMMGEHVGAALGKREWIGVPFVGGFAEVAHLDARTMLVNDLHRHVINLARVVADADLLPRLIKGLDAALFHPDDLEKAQQFCRTWQRGPITDPDVEWAVAYFLCAWLSRAGSAGTGSEFTGKLALRWEAGGGDNVLRFRNATESLTEWQKIFRRVQFTCADAFAEFLPRAAKADRAGHGIYCDPPFPGPGDKYKHNSGRSESEQRAWHERLRDALMKFTQTRIVCRYYDVPLVRELYPESAGWKWKMLDGGRKQTNAAAPEVLLVRN